MRSSYRDDYLTKPINPHELRVRLRYATPQALLTEVAPRELKKQLKLGL